MGAAEHEARRADERLVASLRKLASKNRRVAGFVLPFFNSDPADGDPTTMWGFNDDRIRIRKPDGTIREIVTTAPGASTSSVALPTEADMELYSTTYAATWGRSFCELHGAETGAAVGYGTAVGHGLRRVMLGFDIAQMISDLSGATIRTAEFHMVNLNAFTEPVTVTFGTHESSAPPFVYSALRRNVWADEWPETGAGEEWRQPSGAQLIRVAEWFRDNEAQGLTVEQPDTGGGSGELDWATAQLRVTYTK